MYPPSAPYYTEVEKGITVSKFPHKDHDVIVIGGGSAGYAAARTARAAGADVAIVDHGPLGGLCILRGCMPTKSILRSAEVAALLRRTKEFGFPPVDVRAELSAIMDRKDRLVREFYEYRLTQLHDPQFTLYEARALFRSPHEIVAGDITLSARSFIIATGSSPNDVAVPGLAESGYFTSDNILDLRAQPSSLLVLGGGPVAVEFGQFFSRLGTKVTVIQRGPTVLSQMDEDVARALEAALREDGIEIVADARLLRVNLDGGRKSVWVEQAGRERVCAGEEILQALGRRPNISGMQLEKAGVKIERGRIVIDQAMRTSQPHIYAVGDVNDLNPIVHLAIRQGEVAGYNATHADEPAKEIDHRLDAEVIFTDPQVAVVGFNERLCRANGLPYLAASYPFADHGKALLRGDLHGFVKLLAAPSNGRILGAQIVGPEAGELIHELIAVMYYHGTAEDLLRIPHYHPTLTEIITYPAESLVGQLGAL